MRLRIAANKFRVTATSASWNVKYFACRVTLAPILIRFSRSVVSDQCRIGFGKASRRRKLPPGRRVNDDRLIPAGALHLADAVTESLEPKTGSGCD
jgi:hypothetical protein